MEHDYIDQSNNCYGFSDMDNDSIISITKINMKTEDLLMPVGKSLCGEIYRDFNSGNLSFRCTICYIEVHLITEYSYHLDEHYLNQTKSISDDSISIPPQIETVELNDEFKNNNAYLLSQNETKNNKNIVVNPSFDQDITAAATAAVAKVMSVAKNIVKELENNKKKRCDGKKLKEFKDCDIKTDEKVNVENAINENVPNKSIPNEKITKINKFDPLKGFPLKVCDYCNESFSSKPKIRIHMRNNHIDPEATKELFCCRLCGNKFKFHHRLMIHMKQNTETTTQQKKNNKYCIDCKLNFNSVCLLRKHNRKQHKKPRRKIYKPKSSIPKSLICDICDLRFTTKVGLEYHMQSHSQNEGFVKCKICEKSYSDKYIKIHMRIHSGVKPAQCQICGECFLTSSKLAFHMRRHDGTLLRHKCNLCSLGFRQPVDLRQHMNIHTGERPYSCDQCHKSFAIKKYLQTHIRAAHTNDMKMHNCRYCTMIFSQASNRNQHEKQKHNIITKYDELFMANNKR